MTTNSWITRRIEKEQTRIAEFIERNWRIRPPVPHKLDDLIATQVVIAEQIVQDAGV